MANKKIDININQKSNNMPMTKQQFMKMPEGYAMMVPVNFISKNHSYDFSGNMKDFFEKEFGKGGFLSASQIASIIKGEDKNTTEKVVIPYLKELLKKETNKDKIIEIENKIKQQESRIKNYRESGADIYGTTLHRLISLIETGKIGKNQFASRSDIIKFLGTKVAKEDKELNAVWNISGSVNNSNLKNLLRNISEYFELKKNNGLEGIPITEQTVAAIVRTKDGFEKIAGTFDQIYTNINSATKEMSRVIVDLKSYSQIKPKESGIQVSTYALLAKAMGLDNVTSGKILQMPRKNFNSIAGASQVKILPSKDIANILQIAGNIYREEDSNKKIALINQAQEQGILNNNGVEVSYITQKDEKGFNKAYIGNRELSSFAKSNNLQELIELVNFMGDESKQRFLQKIYGIYRFQEDKNSPKGFNSQKLEEGYNLGDVVYKKYAEFWDNLRKNLMQIAVNTFGGDFDTTERAYGAYLPQRFYEAGDSASMNRDRNQSRSTHQRLLEDYEPDYWELEERRQQAQLEAGIERKKQGYNDKNSNVDWEQFAKNTAERFMRIIDFSAKIDGVFRKISNELSDSTSNFVSSEELARTWLAKNKPQLYSRYMRSKELSREFPKNAHAETIVKYLRNNQDILSNEETSTLKAVDDIYEKDEGVIKIFEKTLKNRAKNINKKTFSPYWLSMLLQKDDFGQREFWDVNPKFDGEYLTDVQGTDFDEESFLLDALGARDIINIEEKPFSDFLSNELPKMSKDIGVPIEQIKNFIDYFKKVEAVAEQTGLEWYQVLEGIDTQGFYKENSKVSKSLKEINETPVEDLYLPEKGKHGVKSENRKKIINAIFGYDADFGDSFSKSGAGIDSLIERYENFLDSLNTLKWEGADLALGKFKKNIENFDKKVDLATEALIKLGARYGREKVRRDLIDKDIGLEENKSSTENNAINKLNELDEKLNETIDLEQLGGKIEEVKEENFKEKHTLGKFPYKLHREQNVLPLPQDKNILPSNNLYNGNYIQDVRLREDKAGILEEVKDIHKDTNQIAKNTISSHQDISCDNREPSPSKKESPKDPESSSRKTKSQKDAEQKQKEREEKQAISEYNKLLSERLSLEKQIAEYERRRKLTTSGREKQVIDTAIATKRDLLNTNESKRQRIAGKINPDILASLESGYSQRFNSAFSDVQTRQGGARNFWDLMGQDIKRSFSRLFDFGFAARSFNKLRSVINKTIQNIKELDVAMTNIRIVTGMNRDEAQSLMRTYNSMAKELGTTTKAIAQASNEWLRQGYTISETTELIKASTYLSKLGMIDSQTATKDLTSALKGFKLQAKDAMSIVDKLTRLDMNYAASAGEIAEALSRVSAVAQQAGMDLDETAAAVTTIMDVTQQGAEMSGTALRSILSRYGNVKAGSFASLMGDDEDTENLNDIERVLGAIGIQIRSSSKEMRGVTDVLDELSVKWQNLSNVEKNAVATAFGGTRQRNSFLVLMENYGTYKKAIKDSSTSAGTAQEKYDAYMDSIEAHLNKITTAWENFAQKVGDSKFIKFIIDTGATIIEDFDLILQGLIRFVTLTSAFKMPKALGDLLQFVNPKSSSSFGLSFGSFFGNQGFNRSVQQYNNPQLTAQQQNTQALIDNTLALKGQASKEKADGGSSIDLNTINSGLSKSGKNVYKDKSGVWRFKDSNRKLTASQIEEIQPKQAWIQRHSRGIAAAGVGVVNGVTTALTGTSKFDKLLGEEYNNIERGAGERLLTGAITGGLSAAGTAFLGPLGGMIGGLLGDGFGTLIKSWWHADEAAMNKRVKEAEDTIKAIEGVSETVREASEVASISFSDRTSEEQQKANKQYEEMLSEMLALQDKNNGAYTEFLDLFGVDDIDSAIDKLNDFREGNEGATKAVDDFAAAMAIITAEQTYKSKEKDIDKLNKELSGSEYDKVRDYLYASTQKEKDDIRTSYSGGTDKFDQLVQKYLAKSNNLDTIRNQLQEDVLKSGFYSSGVNSLTKEELSGQTLENLIYRMAEASEDDMNKVGMTSFGIDGSIKSDVIDYYTNLLKSSNDKFKSVVNSGGNKTFSALLKQEQQIKKYADTAGVSISELIRKTTNKDSKEFFEDLSMKIFGSTEYAEQLRNEINGFDPTKITRIANAFGLTEEQARGLEDALWGITSDDIIGGIDTLNEKFKDLSDILSNIVSKGFLTSEQISKIGNKYQFLTEGVEEDLRTNSEKIIQNIGKYVFSGYAANQFGSLLAVENLKDPEKFKEYKTNILDKKTNKDFDISEDMFNYLKSLDDVGQFVYLISKDDSLGKLREDFEEYYKGFADVEEIYNLVETTKKYVIDYQNKQYDQEIENLESIKDSLDDINNRREKEINLIKAQQALENAKNEKKKVYRAGIGFTYEADANAIQEAQENLDKLEKDKQKEDLQYQIDSLKQQKDILSAIQNQPELENISELIKGINEQVRGLNLTDLSIALKTLSTDGVILKYDESLGSTIGNTKNIEQQHIKDIIEGTGNYSEVGSLSEIRKNLVNAGQRLSSITNRYSYDEKGNEYENALNDYNNILKVYNDQINLFKDTADKYGLTNYGIVKDENVLNDLNNGYNTEGIKEVGTFSSVASTSQLFADDYLNVDKGNVQYRNKNGYNTIFVIPDSDEKYYSDIIYTDQTNRIKYLKKEYKDKIVENMQGAIFYGGRGDALHYYNPQDDKVYRINAGDHDSASKDIEKQKANIITNASGTLDFVGGNTYINEKGTEAIITPYGTLTALPSHTGIVPADLTSSLYELGEIAPNIIRNLESKDYKGIKETKTQVEDNSTNIDNLNATFNVTEDFDMDKFLRQVKDYIGITRRSV